MIDAPKYNFFSAESAQSLGRSHLANKRDLPLHRKRPGQIGGATKKHHRIVAQWKKY